MRSLIYTLFILFTLLLGGCQVTSLSGNNIRGSGVAKTEKREVAPFTSMDVNGAYQLNVVCQQAQSLEVSGDDNIVPLIITEIREGTLYIRNEQSISPRSKLQVNISAPNIEKLSIAGASNTLLSKIQNDRLEVEVNGAGNLQAAGETNVLEVALNGAAKLNAKELHARKADVVLNGAGMADVYAEEEINATINGVGNINYYGAPKVVNRNISGVGRITSK